MLWVEGQISSSFLPLKMSIPTKWTLACPCLPVLEVDISTILQALPCNQFIPITETGRIDKNGNFYLQHDKSVFTEGRALHRESGWSSRVSRFEMGILKFSHCCNLMRLFRPSLVRIRFSFNVCNFSSWSQLFKSHKITWISAFWQSKIGEKWE